MSFAEHVGAGSRTFGRNLHIGTINVKAVVSQITGAPVGRIVEHGDGRVDAEHRSERTITVSAEQVHGSFREGRAWLYNQLRECGFTHQEALRRMSRERY